MNVGVWGSVGVRGGGGSRYEREVRVSSFIKTSEKSSSKISPKHSLPVKHSLQNHLTVSWKAVECWSSWEPHEHPNEWALVSYSSVSRAFLDATTKKTQAPAELFWLMWQILADFEVYNTTWSPPLPRSRHKRVHREPLHGNAFVFLNLLDVIVFENFAYISYPAETDQWVQKLVMRHVDTRVGTYGIHRYLHFRWGVVEEKNGLLWSFVYHI